MGSNEEAIRIGAEADAATDAAAADTDAPAAETTDAALSVADVETTDAALPADADDAEPAVPLDGVVGRKPPMSRVAWRGMQRLVPLVGAIVSLALAGFGERQVEGDDSSLLPLLLYLVAIACFALSAIPLPLDAAIDLPAKAELTQRQRWWVWAILAAGVGLAGGLIGLALQQLNADVNSAAAAWLWLVSFGVLLLAGLLLYRQFSWSARWAVSTWPQSRWGRWVLPAALLGILMLGAMARFARLDSVPLGIDADEGNRAQVSIDILRGINERGIFIDSWYYIYTFYFWTMAMFFKLFGIGFVEARAYTATAGLLALAVVIWIGWRHFGWRVGLLAGGVLAVMGVALQFSREISEAGVTATLWAISVALFLEGARGGRLWAWIGAGFVGGISIYFYPTGRLWAVLAAAFCVYLLVHGLQGRRLAILGRALLAAAAAIIAVSPFVMNVLRAPDLFALRAQQTSVLNTENLSRLPYYNPEWNTVQMLQAQVAQSIGIFNRVKISGFWPIDQPMFSGAVAVLFLVGLGWVCLRWRDPRFVMLAIWFWVGFVGVIITVETPNVQRMGTAVPVLALFVALVLDNLIRRVAVFAASFKPNWARFGAGLGLAASLLLVATFALQQRQLYFDDYAAMERWTWPTTTGSAVAAQGEDTLVVGVSRSAHLVNSGAVVLLAPYNQHTSAYQGTYELPLNYTAPRNLAFMIFRDQDYYLPYLQSLYPIGSTKVYTHPTEGKMFTMYRVAQADWRATQGAMASPAQGQASHVATLGAAPAGWTQYPSAMRWTAGWRVPQYWNYALEIGPGPASLTLDGVRVLTVPSGTAAMSLTLSLARGIHAISYDGTLSAAGKSATFRWARLQPNGADGVVIGDWQTPSSGELLANQSATQGLYAVANLDGRGEQHLIVPSLGLAGMSSLVVADGPAYTVTLSGALIAPSTGSYSMTMFTQGRMQMQLDGQMLMSSDTQDDMRPAAAVTLTAGAHKVNITYHVSGGNGGIEWVWIPPGGTASIVPAAALSPGDASLSGPVREVADYGLPEQQPRDHLPEIIPTDEQLAASRK